MEIWKKVQGYEGFYEISNTGKLKSVARVTQRANGWPLPVKEKIMRTMIDAFGYETVMVSCGTFSKRVKIHRLLATAFIDNPENLPFVNHRDGNKKNNNLDNLEWCTHSQNMQHAYDIGLKKGLAGVLNPMYGKTGKLAPTFGRTGSKHPLFGKSGSLSKRSSPVIMYNKDGSNPIEYESINMAAIINGFNCGNIVSCLKGRLKTAYGHTWKYKAA